MNNIELLNYSISKKEEFLDNYYMFVEKDKSLDLFEKNIKELKEILITIKRLMINDEKGKTLERLYIQLQNIIGDKGINYSEFGCFINACDSNRNEVKIDMYLLKNITDIYLKKRDLNEIVPLEWIQAIIDKGSSRKKGHTGIKKLIDYLISNDYKETKRYDEFKQINLCFAKFIKNGDFSNNGIKKNFGISLGVNNQNKMLDLLIKKNRDFYFLEAKHMNTGGGAQNKQIVELIDIIKINPQKYNYHFVAFLDGIYFNKLFSTNKLSKQHKDENLIKISNQRKDILGTLKRIKNNYFINTEGFIKLFSI